MRSNLERSYTQQLLILDKAKRIIAQQLENDAQLIAGYQNLIETLSIEYDALLVTAQFPQDFVDRLYAKIAELDAIEEKRQVLDEELKISGLPKLLG